jgi:hypothetical protein
MTDLLTLLAALATLFAGLVALFRRARRQGAADERRRRDAADRAAARATRQRMTDAAKLPEGDPGVLRDWLRARGGE